MIIRTTYITEEEYAMIKKHLRGNEHKEKVKNVRKMMEEFNKVIVKIENKKDDKNV